MDTVIPCQLGYISREVCDGQTTRIPGSLADCREEISGFIIVAFTLSQFHGALEEVWHTGFTHETRTCRVDSCPFGPASINSLKSSTLDILSEHGLKLVRTPDDRTDMPVDSFSSMRLRTLRWEMVISLWGPSRSGSVSSAHPGFIPSHPGSGTF